MKIHLPSDAKRPQDWAFMDNLEIIFKPLPSNQPGVLDGSVSGEMWRGFLEATREEVLSSLGDYRTLRNDIEFYPASLEPMREELKRIQRNYIRDMSALYRQASRTYRNLGGGL